jgi:cell cycle related kinase
MLVTLRTLETRLFTGAPKFVAPSQYTLISTWMTELSLELKLNYRTESLSKCLLVRYINLSDEVTTENMKLCASACLYLASLVAQEYPVANYIIVLATGEIFTLDALQGMVSVISTKLGGVLLYPSPGYWIKVIRNNDQAGDLLHPNIYDDVLRILSFYPESYSYLAFKVAVATYFYCLMKEGQDRFSLHIFNKTYLVDQFTPLIEKIERMLLKVYGLSRSTMPNTVDKSLPTIYRYLRIGLTLHDLEPVPDPIYASSAANAKSVKQGKMMKPIGEGAYGSVYRSRIGNVNSAIKVQSDNIEAAVKELAAMSTLKDKHIQGITGFKFEGSTLSFSMQVARSTLHNFIYKYHTLNQSIDNWEDVYVKGKESPFKLDNDLVKKYTKQLLKGMIVMHQHGIIHRDLKPKNLLISQAGVLKIADFGIAYCVCSGNYDINEKFSEVCTLPYRDYNLATAGDLCPYNFDIDVWAAAIIILELETGIVPTVNAFDEESLIDIIDKVLLNKTPGWIESIPSRSTQKALTQMLVLDRNRRITGAQALMILQES